MLRTDVLYGCYFRMKIFEAQNYCFFQNAKWHNFHSQTTLRFGKWTQRALLPGSRKYACLVSKPQHHWVLSNSLNVMVHEGHLNMEVEISKSRRKRYFGPVLLTRQALSDPLRPLPRGTLARALSPLPSPPRWGGSRSMYFFSQALTCGFCEIFAPVILRFISEQILTPNLVLFRSGCANGFAIQRTLCKLLCSKW